MQKPIIEVNGERIELPKLKARHWRKMIKFDAERGEIPTEDFVDKHCEIIAEAFGVSVDDVLDNLGVDEIIPTYTELLRYTVSMLTDKIGGDKKNAEVVTAET